MFLLVHITDIIFCSDNGNLLWAYIRSYMSHVINMQQQQQKQQQKQQKKKQQQQQQKLHE